MRALWQRNLRAPTAASALMICVSAAPAAHAEDLELGEYLSGECTTCHGGSASTGIPPIVGWPAPVMTLVLEQYRTGERSNPVMQSVVQSLADDEVAALAAWFEQVAPVENNEKGEER